MEHTILAAGGNNLMYGQEHNGNLCLRHHTDLAFFPRTSNRFRKQVSLGKPGDKRSVTPEIIADYLNGTAEQYPKLL